METGLVAIAVLGGVIVVLVAIVRFIVFVLRRNRTGNQPSHPRLGQLGGAPRPPSRQSIRQRHNFQKNIEAHRPTWVRPNELGIHVADIEHMAHRAGLVLSRHIGDHHDPLLLVSSPIARIDQLPIQRRRKPLTSLGWYVISRLCLAFGLLLMVLGVGAGAAFDTPAWIIATVSGIGLLVAANGAALPFILASRDLTQRMLALIGEFDGKARRTILAHQYLLTSSVINDVAAELGYTYLKSRQGWLKESRWNETWITFIRTANANQHNF